MAALGLDPQKLVETEFRKLRLDAGAVHLRAEMNVEPRWAAAGAAISSVADTAAADRSEAGKTVAVMAFNSSSDDRATIIAVPE